MKQGDYLACKCEGKYGYPLAMVTWYKNNIMVVAKEREAILSFKNVGINDGGAYRCEAKSKEEGNGTEIYIIVICKSN